MKKSVGDSYLKIKEHVFQIVKQSGRDPNTVKLIAVTKYFPLEHVISAYEAGCRDFGENKVQEALPKIEQSPLDLHWHLIGSLQKNKVRKVIGKFSLIHSVDSPELAEKISRCGEVENIVSQVLLQVNTSGEKTKHGLSVNGWKSCLDKVISQKNICVAGLMTMAPHTKDPSIIRRAFRALREFRDECSEKYPTIQHLSMGMTNDYDIAIEEGATFVRIGSAIFGKRHKY